jgi:glyoxylase-like metal-dependent hydrolase (beta-lactamase superfamily II)
VPGASRSKEAGMATTVPDEVTTRFTAIPPFAEPVTPWRPEYGGPEDRGESFHVVDDIYVYTAPDYGLGANSTYAITPDGVIVLDTLLLPSHAEDVVAHIRQRTDQPIRYASISHHHPDHTLGAGVFVAAGAELVSSYFTARMIDSHAFWYLMFLNGIFGGQLPESYVVPRNTYARSRQLWLGRQRIQQFELADSTRPAGESLDSTATWFPDARALHVGDTLLSGMHVYFSDGVSVADWLEELRRLRELVAELQPRVLLPGHGKPGDASLIDEQERYLLTMRSLVMDYTRGGEAPLTEEASARLRADIVGAFPEYRNLMAVDDNLGLIQMVGPQGFLQGHPAAMGAAPAPVFA